MSENFTIALVTGVSRIEGIGFETCRQLAQKGMTVLLTARDQAKAEALAETLKGEGLNVTAYALDVTDTQSIAALAQMVEQQFGKLDVLVNNAAGFVDAGIAPLETDIAYTQQALDTNLFGAWRMIQAFVPLLRKSAHGRIVNVSSGAGSFSDPVFGLGRHPAKMTSYAITKLALNGLTVALAAQLKPDNILVNAVNPGFVATVSGMKEMGARPVNEGAAGIVWAATLPDDAPTGGFYYDGQPIGW